MTMNFGTPTFWGGKDGYRSKKADEWSNGFNSTLSLINRDLSQLYNGIKTDEDVSFASMDKVDEQITELSLHEVCAKFVNHCEKLVEMLSEPTNGTVKLSLGKLLAVVKRCLQVTHNDVHSVPSMVELAELLPTVHMSMCNMISQLILCCRTILMPKSRLLVDLCLNALVSMTNMKQPSKSTTRGSIYNVLNLLIETLGWSGYLTTQLKTLTQELILDIKLQKDIMKQPLISDKQDVGTRRKKKGKKKANKAESYSELTVFNEVLVEDKVDNLTSETSSTMAALKLSRYALENVEFLFLENLVRCIIETGKTLQRDGSPQTSSYIESACRKELYKTIFACAIVHLGPGCSRKKVITHFQMSNTALNLLQDGIYLDISFEVQKTCKHVLTVWKLTSQLNRPIVRRILPDDCTEKEDIMEIEREKQQFSEENEQLRQRLVGTEMENKQQSRLIAALQQELKEIKKRNADEIQVLKEKSQEYDDQDSDDELRHSHDIQTVRQSAISSQQSEGIAAFTEPCSTQENMDVDKEYESNSPVITKTVTPEKGSLTENKTPLKRKHETEFKETRELEKTKQLKNNVSSSTQELLESVKKQTADEIDNESLQAMISDFIDAEADIL